MLIVSTEVSASRRVFILRLGVDADAVGLRCYRSIDCLWLVLLVGMLFKLLIFNDALIPYKA